MRSYLDTEQGAKAQWELIKKWDSTENYIVDSWIKDMYLKCRLPLPINSSPVMALPNMNFTDTFKYEEFLDIVVHQIFLLRKQVEMGDYSGFSGSPKTNDFCKDQYKRMFTCYRRAKVVVDELVRRKSGEFFMRLERTKVIYLKLVITTKVHSKTIIYFTQFPSTSHSTGCLLIMLSRS